MLSTRSPGRLRFWRSSSLEAQEERYFWLFISPWIVGFLLFQGGPIVASVVLSLTEWNLLTEPKWLWAGNYVKLFTLDDVFASALVNTVIRGCSLTAFILVSTKPRASSPVG